MSGKDALDRLEAVARALCAADGLDPDEEVAGGSPSDFLTPRIDGFGMDALIWGPRWQTYVKPAQARIAAEQAPQGDSPP